MAFPIPEEDNMETVQSGNWRAWVRAMVLALAASLLAACGGGGGDDGAEATPPPAFEGTWRISLREDGTTTTGGTVPASAVPTQQQVAAITTSSFAQLLGSTSYQGYTVTLNASTITIVGPGTNLAIVVNSVSTGNYRGCDSCGVGAVVSYDVSMNLTANGTIDGTPAGGTGAGTVTVIYTRIS